MDRWLAKRVEFIPNMAAFASRRKTSPTLSTRSFYFSFFSFIDKTDFFFFNFVLFKLAAQLSRSYFTTGWNLPAHCRLQIQRHFNLIACLFKGNRMDRRGLSFLTSLVNFWRNTNTNYWNFKHSLQRTTSQLINVSSTGAVTDNYRQHCNLDSSASAEMKDRYQPFAKCKTCVLSNRKNEKKKQFDRIAITSWCNSVTSLSNSSCRYTRNLPWQSSRNRSSVRPRRGAMIKISP